MTEDLASHRGRAAEQWSEKEGAPAYRFPVADLIFLGNEVSLWLKEIEKKITFG
jgi:hypothetical protein